MEFPIVLCKKVIGRLWSLDKPRKWYKVIPLGLRESRFPQRNLSRQSEYHWTFSSEGNTVVKVVWWWGDVGHLVEFGRTI